MLCIFICLFLIFQKMMKDKKDIEVPCIRETHLEEDVQPLGGPIDTFDLNKFKQRVT